MKKFGKEALTKEMTTTFENIASKNLVESQKSTLELTSNKLDEKNKNTDAALKELYRIASNLNQTTSNMSGHLGEKLDTLGQTTFKLKEVLSSSQRRGQWGEKMVEDILNFIGLKKEINYTVQKQMDDSKGKPDYTFKLPRKRQVNLDVKFPLDNYARYISLEDDGQSNPEGKEELKKQFLDDVKTHINTLKGREYIEQGRTVDYVLMFIPNESIYMFINQEGGKLIDEGLRDKVVLCSPVTLYAVLSLIHQATESFHMEDKAVEIQKHVGEFKKQWGKFKEQMKKMGKAIQSASDSFDQLTKARTRALDKPMEKIEEMSLGSLDDDRDKNALETETIHPHDDEDEDKNPAD